MVALDMKMSWRQERTRVRKDGEKWKRGQPRSTSHHQKVLLYLNSRPFSPCQRHLQGTLFYATGAPFLTKRKTPVYLKALSC